MKYKSIVFTLLFCFFFAGKSSCVINNNVKSAIELTDKEKARVVNAVLNKIFTPKERFSMLMGDFKRKLKNTLLLKKLSVAEIVAAPAIGIIFKLAINAIQNPQMKIVDSVCNVEGFLISISFVLYLSYFKNVIFVP